MSFPSVLVLVFYLEKIMSPGLLGFSHYTKFSKDTVYSLSTNAPLIPHRLHAVGTNVC